MATTNILIVDDHTFIRNAIADMLSRHDNFHIFKAENGFEAIAYAAEYEIHLVLMDIEMPDKDGFETTGELLEKYPAIKVLFLTGTYNKESIIRILELGASGCVLKDADEEELLFAIHKILKGEHYFGNQPMEDILTDYETIVLPRKSTPPKEELSSLTPREKEIIKYISLGMVNKEIAEKLFISKRTIDKHRTNILSKLQMNNSAELIAYAVKYGIVE